jgi:formylglycine-generating enzyme required for sulfatase activity
MVAIPAGTFTMGSSDGAPGEKPPHKVSLSAFCIDKTEVTVAAYRDCTKTTQNGVTCEATVTGNWAGTCNLDQPHREQHPINCVRWRDAVAYCTWAGRRLPTDAEWEYAARGAQGRTYPWGNQPPEANRLNACGAECTPLPPVTQRLYKGDDNARETSPVGQYPAGDTPEGVHDLAGNVWEWVADGFDPGFYAKSPTHDPKGPEPSPERHPVVRGGSWNDGAWNEGDASSVKATRRGTWAKMDERNAAIGFRCAK